LRPDKTSLDTLIKYYGPKGVFPSTDSCVNIDVVSDPLASPTPTPTPTPTTTIGGTPVGTPPATPVASPTATPYYRYYKLQRCSDNEIFYSIKYINDTFDYGQRVYSSSQDISYVITDKLNATLTPGTTGAIPDNISSYSLLQITRSFDVNSLEPLFGCPDTGVSTPNYTRITLIRGGTNTWYNGTYAKEQLCGKTPISAFNYVQGETGGGNIFTKFINYIPGSMTPSTTYNVWDEEDRFTPFNGGNYNYGVMIPESGATITHIVEVSSSGQITNWRSCT
jgi:hypothetical protein